MKSSNPRQGEFTPTSLITFMECPRKYYFQKCMGFQPKTDRNDREFGTAIHEMVSTFYKNKDLSFNERKLKSVKAFISNWDSKLDSSKKNLNIGLVISDKYCDTYKNDSAQYKMDMVESDTVISIPNGTTLYMRIDRILIQDDFYTVVDTKTTGSAITDYYWKDYDLSFQLTCYHYAIEQLVGHCDNIQIDAIKVHHTPEFVRRSFQRTESQVADWYNTYCAITGTIQSSFCSNREQEILNFYQNTTNCGKFGGCPYQSVCKYGLTHPDVQIMFTKGEVE